MKFNSIESNELTYVVCVVHVHLQNGFITWKLNWKTNLHRQTHKKDKKGHSIIVLRICVIATVKGIQQK